MIKKILNTVASNGGDITLSKKELTLATLPSIKFDLIRDTAGLLPPLVETRQIRTVAYTANDDLVYAFRIEQFIDNKSISKIVTYTADSSATDAEIATGLVGSFNAEKSGLKIAASGTASPITFTADAKYDSDNKIAGEPLFTITAISNIDTIASAQTAIPTISSISNATPRVVTHDTGAQVTGRTVTISGVTGATDLNTTWRITYISDLTFSLDGSQIGTAAGGTIVGVQVAQASRGYKGDLIADDITSNDITDNTAYATVTLNHAEAANEFMGAKRELGGLISRLYVSAHSTTSPYTATSNYATFAKRITERLKGVIAEDLVVFVGIGKFNIAAGTWTVTTGGRGDYFLRRTAAIASHVNGIDITAALRTATGKGFKFNSFDLIYGITTDAAVAHSVILSKTAYKDNIAVTDNTTTIATTGTLETATDSDPYVTTTIIDVPIFNITDDSKYSLDLTVEGDVGALVYDFYGVMLKFTKTDVDYEAIGNI